MEVKLHIPNPRHQMRRMAALWQEEVPLSGQWRWDCVDSRVDLDTVTKRELPVPTRNRTPFSQTASTHNRNQWRHPSRNDVMLEGRAGSHVRPKLQDIWRLVRIRSGGHHVSYARATSTFLLHALLPASPNWTNTMVLITSRTEDGNE
jgi:hypothetical protein